MVIQFEVLGYILGSLIGLLLAGGLVAFLLRRYPPKEDYYTLGQYIQDIVLPPKRAFRFAVYSLVAVLIAGAIIWFLPMPLLVKAFIDMAFAPIVLALVILVLISFTRGGGGRDNLEQ